MQSFFYSEPLLVAPPTRISGPGASFWSLTPCLRRHRGAVMASCVDNPLSPGRALLGRCLIALTTLAVTNDSLESRRHTATPNCDVQTCRSPQRFHRP